MRNHCVALFFALFIVCRCAEIHTDFTPMPLHGFQRGLPPVEYARRHFCEADSFP